MNLNSGELVSHYRIIERLGAGGMGVVYKAEDTRLGRTVALKFLPRDETLTHHAKERFIHEARTASALDHPNICTIHEIAETDDGQLFLVMSCYEGETLRSRIRRGTLSTGDSVAIALQLCDALGAAHRKEIVHRDLKPDNIMVLPDGLVKVLDFGLAKFLGQTRLTSEGTTLGTVAYMSPEQVQSSDVDHRADIYSISVILYEMLTGEIPFRGEHQLATFYLIVSVPPAPPRSFNAAIPEGLEAVVLTGMQKERERRFQNCAAMKEQLLPFAGGERPSPIRQDEVPPTRREKAFSQARRPGIPAALVRPAWYGAIVLFVCALALTVVFYPRLTAHVDGKALGRAHREKAVSFMELDQMEDAKRQLDSALTADPNSALTWSTMSAVSLRMGNADLAATQGKTAVRLDSNNANAQYNLGYALEAKGALPEALACYSRAVSVDSLYMPAQSALACLYIRLNDAGRAADMLERAVRSDPASRYLFLLYRSLGKAYFAGGRSDDAISALKHSIALRPDQGGEPYRVLADAYRSRGMIEEARLEMQRCAEAETDPQKKREAERDLRALPSR